MFSSIDILIIFTFVFEFQKIVAPPPNLPRTIAGNANSIQNSILLPRIENNKYCNVSPNGLFFNSQKIVNPLSTGKTKKKQTIIVASMGSKRQNLSNKTPFNYTNQLKIMLANKFETERVRKGTIEALGGEFRRKMKIDAYPIYVLNAALSKAKELTEHSADELSEDKHILEIAGAMWKAIKKLQKENANAVDTVQQLRFVGLVLWHLAVRQNPIIDPENEADQLQIFIAKMWPNIDAHDDTEWQTMLWEFDQNLLNFAIPENRKMEEKVRDDEFWKREEEEQKEKECELMRELEEKMGKGRAKFGDEERHAELAKKFSLLSQHVILLNFSLVYRTFLVFGAQTMEILLFIRALLEGHFCSNTLDEYLENGKQIEINSYFLITHASLRTMANQLLTVGEHIGYNF